MTTFLLKRGNGWRARRRHAHIGHFDAFGRIDRAWCGWMDWDLTSNVPWGRARCRRCLQAMQREATR